MKRAVLLLVTLVVATYAGATGQIPDEIAIDGRMYSLNTNPLTEYLKANPGKLPKSAVMSTALWRGYIARWSVRNQRLYLEDVKIPTEQYGDDLPESRRFTSGMKPLFGSTAPRVATWYSGHLIVPTGELVDYVHMGYGSTYSSYMVVKIVAGTVTQKRSLNAQQFGRFRRAQFESYKKTADYARDVAELKKNDPKDEGFEEFLFQYASAVYLSRIFDK